MTHVPLLLQCIIATPVKTLCSLPFNLSGKKRGLSISFMKYVMCENVLCDYVTTAWETDHYINTSHDGSDMHLK